MKYGCTLLAVRDLERSKRFYRDVLNSEVICDFGANVTLTGGFALQTLDTWKGFIRKDEGDVCFGNGAGELYFEEDDIDGFMEKLVSMPNIEYVHPFCEHAWGQRVVRFYDPDRHIIEVGESMVIVVKRFLDSGLSAEETAARMAVPIEYVKSCIAPSRDISCCGCVCSECAEYQKSCAGCRAEKGKPYWISYTDEDVCPEYACCVTEHGYQSCARCEKLPCELWYKLKDPSQTDEQHEAGVQQRVKTLRGKGRAL
jgi:catechol 2,3-dioxygenase-like lactoylglutathione lyase family enzyme